MAVGYVKRIGTSLCPETTAGPGAGTVCVAEANQNYDYNLVMSRAEAGCEGYIDISTEYGTITFNPKCNVSETATPDYKGYLKTDIIEADCFVGVDSNTVHYNETTLTNTTFPVTFWNNTGDDNGNRCLFGATSNAYGMTFNPATGTFKTTKVCACVDTTYVTIRHANGNGQVYNLYEDSVNCDLSLYRSNNQMAKYRAAYGCFEVYCPSTFQAKVDACCATAYLQYDDLMNTTGYCCSLTGIPLVVPGVRNGNTIYRRPGTICDLTVTYACDSDGSTLHVPYVDTQEIRSEDDLRIGHNNGDTCSYIEFDNFNIKFCGYSAFCDPVCFDDGICVYNEPVCTECGICSGYDISIFYENNSSRRCMYIYCDGEICTNGNAYFCKDVCIGGSLNSNAAYVTTTWNNLKALPNMCAVRCYLYCHCMSQAYASGNTLFIRTQGNISGL